MNKNAVVKKVIAHLVAELESYGKAARAARAEATHEQSKAENKYDTRGLEASYLARGKSRQALELMQAVEKFEKLPLREFGEKEAIETGAVVELRNGKETNTYFIGPRAGG